MKIVTLSSKDIFGGAAKVAYRIHQSLLSNNVDNLFVVNSKRSNGSKIIAVSSLRDRKNAVSAFIHNLRLKSNEKERIRKWDRYLSTREDKVYMDLEISLLGNTLDKLSFDILQLHWVGESFVNFTEFENVRQPVVWTLHDCFAFTGICTYFEECNKFMTHCGNCPQLHSNHEKDYSYEIFEQKLERYKNIDFHIVCPSKWLAEEAKKSVLLGRFPIEVIPNGIDTDFFHPIAKPNAKTALGISPEKKTILFGGVGVARDQRKGGDLLIEALHNFKRIYPNEEEIELLIFGADTTNIDFGFKTTHLGYIDNEMLMRIVYSAADVAIVPSRYENLPTVIMEGMSCGTPVVAFDIGGNSDMIDHKENGYLAIPYETSDLANGIKYCFENNQNRRLDNNARNKILDNFEIQDITQRYIDLYKSLLNK